MATRPFEGVLAPLAHLGVADWAYETLTVYNQSSSKTIILELIGSLHLLSVGSKLLRVDSTYCACL